MTQLTVSLIQDREALQSLRHEWNALLQSSRSDCVFLTWEWVSTWWEVYGPKYRLHLLTARNSEGVLVGLAPLKRVSRRLTPLWSYDAVEFIGNGGDVTPEYLDFIAAPGLEEEVVDTFLDRLQQDRTIGIVDLRPLPETSPNLNRARQRLAGWARHIKCKPDSVCPVLILPETPEAFVAGRSRNYRRRVRESERRCERDLHAAFEQAETPDQLRADLSALRDLHRRRWTKGSRAFRSREYNAFHEQLGQLLLERGWMRLFLLKNTKPLAALYCFSYHGRYYYYQAGRDPEFPRYRLGLVLMHHVICEAIREKAKVFDFLSGDEAYKYQWAQNRERNVRLVVCRSVGALVSQSLYDFSRWLSG